MGLLPSCRSWMPTTRTPIPGVWGRVPPIHPPKDRHYGKEQQIWASPLVQKSLCKDKILNKIKQILINNNNNSGNNINNNQRSCACLQPFSSFSPQDLTILWDRCFHSEENWGPKIAHWPEVTQQVCRAGSWGKGKEIPWIQPGQGGVQVQRRVPPHSLAVISRVPMVKLR